MLRPTRVEDDAVPSLFSCSGATRVRSGMRDPASTPATANQQWPSPKRAAWWPDSDCGKSGGAEEIRTPDLRRAKAALSQLSYGPSGLPAVLCLENGVLSGLLGQRWWWAILDSNQRPQSYQDCALTI